MRSRLQAVGEPEQVEEIAIVAAAHQPRVAPAIAAGLMLALKALSQRAVVALAALEHMILACTVFALWLRVIAQPTELQLVGVGLYALFVLSLVWLRTRL